jgi:hypothetical protein
MSRDQRRTANAKARGELIDAEAEYHRDFAIAHHPRPDPQPTGAARAGLAGLGGDQAAIEIRLEAGLREALTALADYVAEMPPPDAAADARP